MKSMGQLDDSQKAALGRVAQHLVAAPRGILAADQEPEDMDKILIAAGGGAGPSGWTERLAFRKATLTAGMSCFSPFRPLILLQSKAQREN